MLSIRARSVWAFTGTRCGLLRPEGSTVFSSAWAMLKAHLATTVQGKTLLFMVCSAGTSFIIRLNHRTLAASFSIQAFWSWEEARSLTHCNRIDSSQAACQEAYPLVSIEGMQTCHFPCQALEWLSSTFSLYRWRPGALELLLRHHELPLCQYLHLSYATTTSAVASTASNFDFESVAKHAHQIRVQFALKKQYLARPLIRLTVVYILLRT